MIKPVEIARPWHFEERQVCKLGNRTFQVHDCIRLAKDLPVEDVQIRHMYMAYGCPCGGTLRSFVAHMRMVTSADLDCPVLLDEDGMLIDGKHRLARALLEDIPVIKVKRFDVDPEDGYVSG